MKEQTRYRLTGAIFLLSIGIIVLPMVFDGEGVRVKQLPELSEPLPPIPSDAQLEALEISPAEIDQHLAEQELTGALLDKDGFHTEDGTRIGDPALHEPEDSAMSGVIGRATTAANEKTDADGEPSVEPEPAPRPVTTADTPARRAPPVPVQVATGTSPETAQKPLAKQAIWAVQLASFASPVNAAALRDRLLGDGFEAWTSTARSNSGVRTRVAIGPLLDRGDAERMRTMVSGRYNVSAIIVHMKP